MSQYKITPDIGIPAAKTLTAIRVSKSTKNLNDEVAQRAGNFLEYIIKRSKNFKIMKAKYLQNVTEFYSKHFVFESNVYLLKNKSLLFLNQFFFKVASYNISISYDQILIVNGNTLNIFGFIWRKLFSHQSMISKSIVQDNVFLFSAQTFYLIKLLFKQRRCNVEIAIHFDCSTLNTKESGTVNRIH